MRASPPDAGFTLIELMVALAILSLLFLLLVSGLHLGTKFGGLREESLTNTDTSQVSSVQETLRRMLSQARPAMVKDVADRQDRVLFVGTKDSIRFVAPLPSHLGVGGWYDIAIYLAKDEQLGHSGRLMMSWRIFRGSGASPTAGIERKTVLLSGVSQIWCAYYGFHIKKPKAWYNDWQGLWFLPDLIRIRVKFSRNDLLWPDLVVAPLVNSLEVKKMDKIGVVEAE